MKELKNLPQDIFFGSMNSPVGELVIIASKQGVHSIAWKNKLDAVCLAKITECADNELILATKQQLSEYFAGQRKKFDLPLVMNGTDFQKRTWEELLKIPYGETISYGTQALRLGDAKKARAVGAANGMNPLPIVVPCHRVIGSQGKLTGFAGGIEHKAYLLGLESS